MSETIDNRPVHIYFMPELPETVASESFKKTQATLTNRIVCCTSWAELAEMFKLNPKTICVNSAVLGNQSMIEIINMLDTFAKLVGMTHEITVTLGVNKDTDYKTVKETQKLKIIGIIPASKDFGIEETMKGCNAQWNNIPYWPKHIIEQLPGAKKTHRKDTTEIKLTPRQDQILFLIKERGASNKVIAKTLNITESTVKLHVGLILKKFGVKNRTQLAVFSRK